MAALRSLIYVGFAFVMIAAWFVNQRKRSNLPDYGADSKVEVDTSKFTGEGIAHPQWRHRLKAVEVLRTQEHSADTLNTLIRLLDDTVFDIREAAAVGIVQYGNAAIPGLAQVLAIGKLDTRETAIQTLCKIGTPETIPVLIRALQEDESAWIRIPAAIGLGEIGGEAASAALSTALEDPHPDVVAATKTALNIQTGQEIVPPRKGEAANIDLLIDVDENGLNT